jgi:hypothetical protein
MTGSETPPERTGARRTSHRREAVSETLLGRTGAGRAPHCFWERSCLFGEEGIEYVAAVDDLDGAAAGGHQLLVAGDADLVVDGGRKVGDIDAIGIDAAAESIR